MAKILELYPYIFNCAALDANGNPISTVPVTGQQQTTTTSSQGQGPAFNSFLFPATPQTSASTSFNLQPGSTVMTNNGMFTSATRFFDASSGMPIGTPSSVMMSSSGQLIDGSTGLPVTTATTMQMNPGGMQMNSAGMQMNPAGMQMSSSGFQGTNANTFNNANQFPSTNFFNTNTGTAAGMAHN